MNKYQKKHRFKNIILSVFVAFLALFMCLSVQAGTYINASAAELSGYDSTDVVADLEGMTIYDDGEYKSFNISDYAPNDYTQTDVLVFAEYKFPTYVANIDSFELYVYVWNPQRISYELRSELNYIELGVSADGEYTTYNKYQLKYLDVSDESGYSGVFIKYKVVLSDSQKQEFYNTFTGEERYYHVAGLELLVSGETNATDYDINKEYIYSGYAAGCGADSEAESTLSFYQDVGTTLSLDVNSTVYRAEGSNGVNDYTQDSLHSVYFSVPNDVLSEYGELYGVHASWLNAVLAPTLVIKQSVLDDSERTGLQEQLDNYLGKDISEDYDNTEYAIVAYEPYNDYYSKAVDCLGYYFWYNKPSDSSTLYVYERNHNVYTSTNRADSNIDNHYTDGSLNMADVSLNTLYMYLALDTDDLSSYIVPTGTLQSRMLELTNSVYSTDSKVAGKYASNLFSSVDSEYTEVTIYSDDEFSLTSSTLVSASSSFWGLWSTNTSWNYEYEDLTAIYAVQSSDMTGTDEEICENLKIGEGDIDDFKAYYEEATANGETVYLFRYQQSDYEAIEGTIFDRNSSDRDKWYEVSGTNCYFFQETVNLGFDIIDVTFRGDNTKLTTIAVLSDPIDVIAEPTEPVGMTDSSSSTPWWVYVVLVLGELVVLLVLRIILCTVCGVPKWVWWIIFLLVVVLNIFFITTFAAWLYSLF